MPVYHDVVAIASSYPKETRGDSIRAVCQKHAFLLLGPTCITTKDQTKWEVCGFNKFRFWLLHYSSEQVMSAPAQQRGDELG